MPTNLTPVPVSNVPQERMDQLVGLFHRNPGWIKTGPVGDALRSAFDHVPVVGTKVRELTEPADVGYGQAIRDQTQWQIDSGRQPNNPWWLRMNRQLVEDPLTAERAIRAGTEDQLETRGQKAWAEYIHRSDAVGAALGLSPQDMADAAAAGSPVTLSDAWKGASLLDRAKVALVLKSDARAALWKAHRETLEDGRPLATAEAAEMHARSPEEMSFSSSWATLIGHWSRLNPPVTGHQSTIAQRWILPFQHPIKHEELSFTERAFTKLADWIDPRYEREIAAPAEA